MPDRASVARFRTECLPLLGTAPGAAAPLAIAVSGGADSMALLALAHAAFPGSIAAATVDHRLRPGSDDEAAMVARWCADAGIDHATLAADHPLEGPGIQARARAMRYRLLRRWALGRGAMAIATAHHADDQAETFLMRATRGAGIAGLRGIPARSGAGDPPPPVVRPLLTWRRAELRALSQAAGVPFVDDPSNADDRFERARVRALLAEPSGIDPAALAASAAHLAEADAALATLADRWWDVHARCEGGGVALGVDRLPRELRRRLLRRAVIAVRREAGIARPPFDDAASVEPMLALLEAGERATRAGVLAIPDGAIWRFRPAPPRRTS